MSKLQIDEVIRKLGYETSNHTDITDNFEKHQKRNSIFLYKNNGIYTDKLKEYGINKLISILNPDSLVFIDDKPLIVFYEESKVTLELQKKIWNVQIPFIILNSTNCIKIYSSQHTPSNAILNYLESIYHNDIGYDCKYSFWHIFEQHLQSSFQSRLAIDLIENIKYVLMKLSSTKSRDIATKLLLRLIFIRYLIDREINIDYDRLNGTIQDNRYNFLSIIESKNDLYKLFEHLKQKFNGNLFDVVDNEIDIVESDALSLLQACFSSNLQLKSGQYSLFELYDFNIIPVELISSIYECILNDETTHNDKVYYTPPYLADYIVQEVTDRHLKQNNSFTILDPSCGSGIFLVNSARKIIEKNLHSNNNDIVPLITQNIYGIDKNEDAINVAIFSLYITILDYIDPKNLKNFKLPTLKGCNLFVSDFFDSKIDNYFKNIKLDFIIGNPPWGQVTGEHIAYCKKNKYELLNKEISRSFIYRTKDFSSAKTICSLIVTSKILYNKKTPAKKFREYFLKECTIYNITELAPARKILFQNAVGPACIISYSFQSNIDNIINFLTIKPAGILNNYNIITIDKYDYKKISQKLLLNYDWAWKTMIYGTMIDVQFINDLRKTNLSLEQIIKNNGLFQGTGIQLNGGNSMDSSMYFGMDIIDSKYIGQYTIDKNGLSKFTIENVHSNRANNQNIFKQYPKVLILKGTSNTYANKAVYTSDEFLFKEAVRAICGLDKNIMQSITGVINSSLYNYLNLMLGSSIGIEREQVFFDELLSYPMVIDDNIAHNVQSIQDKISSNMLYSVESEINQLNDIVLHAFNITNDEHIDYALNIQIPLIKNTYKTEVVQEKHIQNYISIFTNYFNEIGYNIDIKVNNYLSLKYCDIIFEINNKTNYKYKESNNIDSEIMQIIIHKVNDMFYKQQDIIIFGEDYFRIIKNNDYRYWHPLIARLDLSDIVNSILLGK